MRDFGSLPRPTSRFRRPRGSWIRRVLQAVQLRFGFLMVYAVVAGFAFYQLYLLGRSYGYCYSLKERQQLWTRFPDREVLSTMILIYGSESAIPEMRLTRAVYTPFYPNPNFSPLLKDPLWASQARRALGDQLDTRLSSLGTNFHFFRFEELLAASENGHYLTAQQRQRLDEIRRTQVEWYVQDCQPENETLVQVRRYKMLGWYRLPGPLEADWRAQILAKARNNQVELVKELSLGKAPSLPILRRLQLQVALAGLDARAAGQLQTLARGGVKDCMANLTDESVILVAHYKKLLPRLDLSSLTPQLNPTQLKLLDCLRDLTSSPPH